MAIREGQSFGNYRVLNRIGSGGMGAVYLAEHPLIGKRVALKVIHRDLATNREVVSRFFNEARAVNQIGNEHIVEINDFGQTPEGDHFFVMEHIEGRTLADVLEREGALHPQRALHIAAQIADALGAAHACAIIHRDLKPDNIMLTWRMGNPDFVKVLDFGLAKMLAESNATKLTAQGVVLGTPQYMAPEICESSQGIDQRSDIYALGVLLFQMATGRLPFDGTSMGSILIKHVTEPPPAPRGINPGIPPSVEQIILRCLAKSPDGRFASMTDLRQVLLDPDRYLAGGPPVMRSASPAALVGASGQMPPPAQWNGQWNAQQPAQPGMPSTPANRTMHIGTPVGYRHVPPRKSWPLAVALAAVAAVTGAAVVLLLLAPAESEQVDATAAGEVAADAAPAHDAGPGPQQAAAIPADAAAAATVTIRLATAPPGARVFDLDDNLLGETPAEISLPRDGEEHVLVFRHPRTRERRKTVRATHDAEFELELQVIERSGGARQPRQVSPRRTSDQPRGDRTRDQRTPRPRSDRDIMAPDF